MSVPEIVHKHLGGETPIARVPLKGDDELLVTATRTLVYRAEGLLSGESVEEYPHDAEGISINEGRRKSTIRLDHGIDGQSELSIPSGQLNEILGHILGGVLSTAGIIGDDERVDRIYRLGELTIVITDARVIKHIGNAVWDEEYEQYEFEHVTGLDIEQGDVSSQVIVEVNRRPQRIKTPSNDAREVREQIERALLEYHDADSYTAFKRTVAPDEPDNGVDKIDASTESADTVPDETITAIADAAGLGMTDPTPPEPTTTDGNDLATEVAELRDAVEHQTELLQRHQATIEQLIEELRRLNT